MMRKAGYHLGDEEHKHMHKKKKHQNVNRRNLWEVGFWVMFLFSTYDSTMSGCYFGYKGKNKAMQVIFRGKELPWTSLIHA